MVLGPHWGPGTGLQRHHVQQQDMAGLNIHFWPLSGYEKMQEEEKNATLPQKHAFMFADSVKTANVNGNGFDSEN